MQYKNLIHSLFRVNSLSKKITSIQFRPSTVFGTSKAKMIILKKF